MKEVQSKLRIVPCSIERANMRVDSVRVALPLFQTERGGSTPASTLQLVFERCPKKHARDLNREWHSRMSEIALGGISYCFHARCGDVSYAVALWSHPVASGLPQDWVELRRLAVAPDAPKNTASCFLAWMIRWLKKNTQHPMALSYQDTEVHKGTIYKASGWTCIGRTHMGGKCGWDNNVRQRAEINGSAPLLSIKHRWQMELGAKKI